VLYHCICRVGIDVSCSFPSEDISQFSSIISSI
jgi:hypothetical protein